MLDPSLSMLALDLQRWSLPLPTSKSTKHARSCTHSRSQAAHRPQNAPIIFLLAAGAAPLLPNVFEYDALDRILNQWDGTKSDAERVQIRLLAQSLSSFESRPSAQAAPLPRAFDPRRGVDATRMHLELAPIVVQIHNLSMIHFEQAHAHAPHF